MTETQELEKVSNKLARRDTIQNIVYPAFVAIILLVQGALIGISLNNSHYIHNNSKQIDMNTDSIARSQENILVNQKLLAQLLENEKEEIRYLKMITDKQNGYFFSDELEK